MPTLITDKAGADHSNSLFNYFAKDQLFVENAGDTPTFDNGRWTNSIDLILPNAKRHDLMDWWQEVPKDMDENCFDRNIITYKISPKFGKTIFKSTDRAGKLIRLFDSWLRLLMSLTTGHQHWHCQGGQSDPPSTPRVRWIIIVRYDHPPGEPRKLDMPKLASSIDSGRQEIPSLTKTLYRQQDLICIRTVMLQKAWDINLAWFAWETTCCIYPTFWTREGEVACLIYVAT